MDEVKKAISTLEPFFLLYLSFVSVGVVSLFSCLSVQKKGSQYFLCDEI